MKRWSLRSLALPVLVGAGLLASHAAATWSIIVVDRATGEVCSAGATCIPGIGVRKAIGVVVVGKGAGAAQSAIDSSGNNRRRIFNGLMLDRTPDEILALLQSSDQSHNTRQYGIVSLEHGALTFTGGAAGFARFGVAGEHGTLAYAIQGNVLTGDEVVLAAEQAILNTAGDLGQRVMAGMEAARSFGGDGRCSCSYGTPTSCGSPPASFTKSAHSAYITIGRIGDEDGTCSANTGCVNGSYYLHRQFIGDVPDNDPVLALQARYDNWRAALVGEVDQILTEVTPSAPRLVADGTSTVDVRVRLRDVDNNPLAFGGQNVQLRGLGATQPASIVGILDNGDGSHTITVQAGMQPGVGRWRILVSTGAADPILLNPPLTLRVDALTPLHAGFEQVSATEGADVPVIVNVGAASAGRAYQILASAAGTVPGSIFHGGLIPLNADRLLRFTANRPGSPLFPGSAGAIDANGRAEATLRLTPGLLAPFVGDRFDLVAVVFGTPDDIAGPAGFQIVP